MSYSFVSVVKAKKKLWDFQLVYGKSSEPGAKIQNSAARSCLQSDKEGKRNLKPPLPFIVNT
jgi:hypothetical protein